MTILFLHSRYLNRNSFEISRDGLRRQLDVIDETLAILLEITNDEELIKIEEVSDDMLSIEMDFFKTKYFH